MWDQRPSGASRVQASAPPLTSAGPNCFWLQALREPAPQGFSCLAGRARPRAAPVTDWPVGLREAEPHGVVTGGTVEADHGRVSFGKDVRLSAWLRFTHTRSCRALRQCWLRTDLGQVATSTVGPQQPRSRALRGQASPRQQWPQPDLAPLECQTRCRDHILRREDHIEYRPIQGSIAGHFDPASSRVDERSPLTLRRGERRGLCIGARKNPFSCAGDSPAVEG